MSFLFSFIFSSYSHFSAQTFLLPMVAKVLLHTRAPLSLKIYYLFIAKFGLSFSLNYMGSK
jgi:hypothetical protein